METKYFTTSDEDLKKAAAIIKSGGLVAFPTETVYGLGGNALNPFAAKAIYAAKGRPSDNPLIVHIADVSEVNAIAMNFPKAARMLAEAIWPGPMTLVLPKFDVVPNETTGGLNTVAVRLPESEIARKLIEYSGVPIAAPSANTSGCPSPTKWEHVKADLDGKIDAIIMGEPCSGGIESTVIDVTESMPLILRPGIITPEKVTSITGLKCDYDPAIKNLFKMKTNTDIDPAEAGDLEAFASEFAPKAPGMKYKHYAPKAEMTLFSGDFFKVVEVIKSEKEKYNQQGKKVACIIYSDGVTAAKNLFADLRKADEDGADIILASALPENESINYSVMNRMLKSAGYKIIEV